MFLTTRYFFKNDWNAEDESLDCTFKNFDTLDKAMGYATRYSTGKRFARLTIEDENGKLIREITIDEDNIF